MTGAGAPRATFGFGFRSGHSSFHSIARGVTDPGIGCTDWLGLFSSGLRSDAFIVGFDVAGGSLVFRRGSTAALFELFLGELFFA